MQPRLERPLLVQVLVLRLVELLHELAKPLVHHALPPRNRSRGNNSAELMFTPAAGRGAPRTESRPPLSLADAEIIDQSNTKRPFKFLTNSLTAPLDKSPSFDSNQK